MPDPRHFDRMAELYDRARPPYPEALWELLRSRGLLGDGVRVLELGAGSGQATGPMRAAGAAVTAIEPGASLAALLRTRWPEVDVREQSAETVELPAHAFDLAVIATAVHWLDLDVVLPRIHTALVDGGSLAVWRTAYGDPDAPTTPFRERVAEIVATRDAPPRPGPGETETAAWSRLLEGGGLFRTIETATLRWSIELDAPSIRDLFTTFSDWTPEEAEEASRAVQDLGGSVVEHYLTPVILLERRA